ncbi:MAG: hypothetical protein K8H86_06370 [Ignavibacteriaceae bacterium]|nr:hypothetical protein [Ignavibacteriaceae bacterium]
MQKILLLFVTSLLISSCSKDNPVNPPPSASSKGIYVVNEGAFSQNNASLTYYNLETGDVDYNAYSNANNGTPLGDNANSMFILNDKGYIAVDNSNKIEIINLDNFKSLGQIDLGAGGSPREIWMVDSTEGYATSLYSNQVIKFNTVTKSITKKIDVGSYPEGIVGSSGKLFVANSGFGVSNSISVIDIATQNIIKTLHVGFNPRVIIAASDGNVYVACSGSFTDTTVFSGVYKINPVTALVVDSIKINKNPGEMCEVSGSRLFVVNSDGVNSVDMSFTSSPNLTITAAAVNNVTMVVYSIAYDKNSQTIYCGNPKDFTQNGEVAAFNINGSELKRFNTGINPGSIVVRN